MKIESQNRNSIKVFDLIMSGCFERKNKSCTRLIMILIASFFFIIFSSSAFSNDVFPSRYHTYSELFKILNNLQDSYPEILVLDTLGFSTRENIPIYQVKISDNPLEDEDEPAVLFNAGVHGDELLGVETALNFVQDVVKKYSQGDPEVIRFVKNLEIYVIPVLNPEGHITVDKGDLDWRKNKSDNESNGIFDHHDGVDNNRNYDFGWSLDSDIRATTPESLMFKGFYPFSESENQAMRDFGWKYRPIIAIDYHSPVFGQSEVAYYPWLWRSDDGGQGYSPDESVMREICEEYCSLIITDAGNSCYESRRALVNKGDMKTFLYGNFGSVAFAVEISDTTIQKQSMVDDIVSRQLPGQYYLLNRALGSGITGIIKDSITFEPLEAEIQILEHVNSDINPRFSRPDFGRCHRLLAPGTYTLKIIKDGYYTKTIPEVVVSSEKPAKTDVLLVPINPIPSTPMLLSPSNRAIHIYGDVNFAWESAVIADGYVIEIARDKAFKSIIMFDSSLNEPQYHVSRILADGSYYWRVAAFNGNGYSNYSENRYLDIITTDEPYIIGDVNNDQLVIGADVSSLVGYFLGYGNPPPIEISGFFPSADVNGDCQNDITDVVYLVKYFLGAHALIDGHCFSLRRDE